MDFLKYNYDIADKVGFWTEENKTVIKLMLETRYKDEIIQEWFIDDVVFNNDKVLIKWMKRLISLTEQQLNDRYGE